jgi:hypothetical protein
MLAFSRSSLLPTALSRINDLEVLFLVSNGIGPKDWSLDPLDRTTVHGRQPAPTTDIHHREWRHYDDRGDDLAGVKPTQRSVVGVALANSSSALVVHAQREGSKSARSPGMGKGRCRVDAGKAGLAVFAQGMAVRRIETRSGSTHSATARSGPAGCLRALPRHLPSHGPKQRSRSRSIWKQHRIL